MLVISQFTLSVVTNRDLHSGFSRGAAPADDGFTYLCRQAGIRTETGRFVSDMQVALINDGLVTFWI
ncbi:D-aminoacyl-tRNA deacylase [Sodalis-like endosymbiont of Proechinophthirus fluctus]|uniref:D-aminoacyl-tRNA deacylase n=1 Tax=Sodalis-like endosymbiont of Proechinophthirus fluctus TaxID=1462730 RepID=UPI000B268ADA